MGFLLAVILSFVPALACAATVYWLDRYEKEPKVLLGAVFGWGAIVATLGALVAQTLLGGMMQLVMLGRHLAEEVQLGRLTPEQYHTALSGRARARLRAALSGRLPATRRFYEVCGELAHKKNQLTRYGEEDGNAALVEGLRNEMAQLSGQAAA